MKPSIANGHPTADAKPRQTGPRTAAIAASRDGPLRIVVVSAFFSEGMGYTENCLPRALAARGHDVHVITSTFNVYGTSSDYEVTYQPFLGPPVTGATHSVVDGYRVRRLESTARFGYVRMRRLGRAVRGLRPDIVHSLEIASLETWELALNKPIGGYRLFTETHQHMSVVRPYLKRDGSYIRKALYRATRTLPTQLAGRAVEKCYAISPDCATVATTFFGVDPDKITHRCLGTDTTLFHPVGTRNDSDARQQLRGSLGFSPDDIVCVYSGRFSADKNPLVLARAIDALSRAGSPFKALFIGDGAQKREIAACANVTIVGFSKHEALAAYYRAADIGVWTTQESMSMLDAAASGLPLVVSAEIGETGRVTGNGLTYAENDVGALVATLRTLRSADRRRALGAEGRRKMVAEFSWARVAAATEADYLDVLGRGGRNTDSRPIADKWAR